MNPSIACRLVVWSGIVLFWGPMALAADIAPATTTATFSQTSYPVINIVDFDPSSGWAIHDATSTSAQSAFIESATHFGMLTDNLLTFNIAHDAFSQHAVGRFRLSASTDKGALGGGSNWTVLEPLSVASTGGATLTVNPDYSILASGTNPTFATYTVQTKLPTGMLHATGFRLEAMEDPSLPTSGPGRYPSNGNFVMTDFAVDVSSRVELQQATANFSQTNCCGDGGLLISKTINGISGQLVNGVQEGWGFGGAPATVNGAFETVADVGFADGTKLRFGIDHRMFNEHNLANVKFFVTGDDRSTFANGVSNGGDPIGTANWVEVMPLRATSEGGALVSIGTDHRLTFGGANPVFDTYTIEAISPIANVTGMRMEIIGTKGRYTNGNAVVSEITLDAAPTKLVALQNPSVTFQQGAPYVVANSINGVYHNGNEGWGVSGGQTQNQSAVFQTASPLFDANTLTFTLIHPRPDAHNIQRFRLSATTDASPTTVSGANWTVLDPLLVYLDNSGGYSVDANSIRV